MRGLSSMSIEDLKKPQNAYQGCWEVFLSPDQSGLEEMTAASNVKTVTQTFKEYEKLRTHNTTNDYQ